MNDNCYGTNEGFGEAIPNFLREQSGIQWCRMAYIAFAMEDNRLSRSPIDSVQRGHSCKNDLFLTLVLVAFRVGITRHQPGRTAARIHPQCQ